MKMNEGEWKVEKGFNIDTSSYCVLCVYLFTKIDIVCAIAKSKRHVAGCQLRCRLEVKLSVCKT